MHLAVLFNNVGGYHAARLRAVNNACLKRGWKLTAVQVTDNAKEHPWGDLNREITFGLETLIPANEIPLDIDRGQMASDASQRMRSFLERTCPDIVAIPGWGTSVSRSTLSWSKKNQALALLMSESKKDDDRRQWWKESLKSWLYIRKFDAALVGGKPHRDYLIELGFPDNKIFTGYDAVDNNFFAHNADVARQNPAAARLRQPNLPVRPYFLAVTRLIKRKNVLRLIEAFADYHQQVDFNTAWDLAVCGSGEQEAAIRDLIDRLGIIEYVHLPGFISYQNIGDWYGLASAFVHPPIQEQWGLVMNEACAAGLPVLCSSTVGAAYELVRDNQNGFLFNPEIKEDITRTLLRIHRLGDDQRLGFGKCGERIVANYGPERFASGLFKAVDAASLRAV